MDKFSGDEVKWKELEAKAKEINERYVKCRTEMEISEKAANEANKAWKLMEKDGKELEKTVAELSDLEALKSALGQNGIRSVIVDIIAPRLEEKTNEILSKMSDFTVSINTQKTGSTGGTVEGLFVIVKDGLGREMDIANYSGGEKQKVMVSISEALAEMQRLDFRILDEAFTGLDSESVEKYSEALMSVKDRYNQLLCVSHIDVIKNLFADRLTATKEGGITTII